MDSRIQIMLGVVT